MLRLLESVLGLCSSGCGVLFGNPVELFPAKAGPDGGLVDSSPCVEQVQQVSGDNVTIIGAPASTLAALVEGTRTNDMIWPGVESSSLITVTTTNVQVFSVHSRANQVVPQHLAANQCADHVRIEASLTLATADGRLDESVSKVTFTVFDVALAHTTFELAKAAYQGSYAPKPFGQRCFTKTTFSITGELGTTNGGMVDEFRSSCDAPDAGVVMTLAGGHWGADWQDQ